MSYLHTIFKNINQSPRSIQFFFSKKYKIGNINITVSNSGIKKQLICGYYIWCNLHPQDTCNFSNVQNNTENYTTELFFMTHYLHIISTFHMHVPIGKNTKLYILIVY